MSKTKRPVETQIFLFALKIFGSLVLALIVAISIDISHMSQALTQLYGQSL